MIDELHNEFASLADAAPGPEGMLESVHRRATLRRDRRRRGSVLGTVGAVAVVAVGAVILSSHAPTVKAATAHAGEVIAPSQTYLPGDPGMACASGDYVPAPAPLVSVVAEPSTNLALGVLPQGWTVNRSDDSDVVYTDPADPTPSSADFAGKIVLSVSAIPDQDTSYDTTIGGHAASVQTTDPCVAAGYPGSWLVNMQWGSGIEVQLQGPMGLKLSEVQIRQMAASIVAHRLVPRKG